MYFAIGLTLRGQYQEGISVLAQRLHMLGDISQQNILKYWNKRTLRVYFAIGLTL